LKDAFDKYSKFSPERDFVVRYMNQFLGNGIFTAMHGEGASDKGEHWQRERKTASMIFSRKNFKTGMHEIFIAKAKRLSCLLNAGETTDMQLHFFNFTMDSIMKILFGVTSDQLGGEDNTYAKNYDIAHRCFFEFGASNLGVYEAVRFLPWPFGGSGGLAVQAMQWFSPVYQEFRKSLRALDTESFRLIEACRADPKLAERADLLALFVQSEDEQKLTTKGLRDTVLNFIIAGRDTTACLLSWMFYILATHPDLQRRITEEVDQTQPGGAEPTFDSLKPEKVPLLHALLYETLRLYPPVPFDGKECYAADVLPDGTHVPVGTAMIFLPYAMGRDPDVWPDPEVVRLERWIPFSAPAQHEFPVFQAGPRYCLGAEMAVFEAKVAAAIILQDWTFTLAPGEAEKIHYAATLTMSVCNSKEQDSHNLWLIPEPRRNLSDSWHVTDPPSSVRS